MKESKKDEKPTKYTQAQLEAMSDLHLNIAVTSIENKEDYSQWAISADETQVYHCGVDGSQYHYVDILAYCNNPDDIMPLVFESRFDLGFHQEGEWCVSTVSHLHHNDCAYYFQCFNKNPLRAAAIVYILVKQEAL